MNIRINTPLCFSEVGKKPNQEDALYPHQGAATVADRVLMVCDGMGGHEHGEVASVCVADTIGGLLSAVPPCTTAEMRQRYEQALAKAYQELDQLDDSPASARKMGTTLTFLALCTDGVLVAHIGDSRVYQLRQGEGVVFQTHDHSLLNDLLAAGELTEEEARDFSQKNVITRAVMPHQEYPSKASYKVLTDIRKGDIFFLCSDGIVEQLDNTDLTTLLLTQEPLQQRLGQVKSLCAQRHTRDNHTCYAVEVDAVEGTVVREKQPAATTVAVQPKPSSPLRRWLWWLIAGIAVLMALVVWKAKPSKSAAHEDKPKVEQAPAVQGTIQRKNN